MIALFLAGVLLATLMNGYKRITTSQVKLEKAKMEVLSHQLIEQRLLPIFTHLKLEEEIEKGKKKKAIPCFYTLTLPDSKGVALILEYDNGTDPDPAFCHLIKSEFYLNQKNELCLISYSKMGNKRKEVFKTNIAEIHFRFLDLKGKEPLIDTWEYDREELPPLMELSLIQKGQPPVEFAFFISAGEEEIVFKQGPP